MKKLLTIAVLIFAANSFAAEKTFKCNAYTKGLSEELKKNADFGTLTVSAEMTKGGLGKVPARNVRLSIGKNWEIAGLAEIRQFSNYGTYVDEVTHDDGSTYYTSTVLITGPLGNFSFYEAEVGVLMTEKGPQEILFRTDGQAHKDRKIYSGASQAGFYLNCKEFPTTW